MNTPRRFNADLLNDPLFIGIDRVLDRINQTSSGQSNYPPYNIIKVDDNEYVIEIALAGFDKEEIDVEIKDGVLTVEGKKGDQDDVQYLH